MSCEYCKSGHYLVNEVWSNGVLNFSLQHFSKNLDWIKTPGWYVHMFSSDKALSLGAYMPIDYCPKCGRKLGDEA